LFDFFHYCLNNVGTPFNDSLYGLNTRGFEREVLYFFAKIYQLTNEPHEDTSWGYITSGGTEGNMYGLFTGRETYPDGILYYSEATHYSIPKIAMLLRVESQIVRSLENGEIDYGNLREMIICHQGKPVILNLNVGTTMKGAIDDIDKVLEVLEQCHVNCYYIHCDAALFGMILPFIKNAPQINFTKPIGSLSISGHKFIGSPMPCGIILTRANLVNKIARHIEYIGSRDTTITGSRNGHTPLILWYAIKLKGYEGFKQEAQTCLENAQYLHNELSAFGYPSMLNEYSNTVLFKKPSLQLIKDWQLPVQDDWSHVVVMQHVNREKIDCFIDELRKSLC